MPPGAVGVAFGAAIGGALYGIIVGLVVHRILGAYLEGAIGPSGCIVSGSLFLALAVAVLVLHSIPLFLLMVLLLALSPFYMRRAESSENRRFYDERIQEHIRALEADPRNLAARSSLADALYKRGYLDEAIEQYTDVLRLAPKSHEDAYRLKHLIKERDERRDPLITCPSCGHKNPKSRLRCMNCEVSLAPADRLKQWLAGPTYKQFVRLFAIAAGAVTLIVLLGSLLSPVGKIVSVLIAVIILGIVFLVNTFMNA